MIAEVKHLYMRACTGTGVNPHYTVILTVLLIFAVAGNSLFYTGGADTLLYCAGFLNYFLLVFFKYRYRCSVSDYIPSGEGAIAIITVVLLNILITENIFLVLLLTVIILTLINGLIRIFDDDRLFSGLVINITLLATLVYIAHAHSGISNARLGNILTGAAHISGHTLSFAAVCFISALLIIFLTSVLEPELALYSHGRSFFSITGIPPGYAHMTVNLAGAALLAAVILSTGLLAGTGLYIYHMLRQRASLLEMFLIMLLYTQVMVMLTAIAGPVPAVYICVAASYIMHTIYIFRWSDRHA